MIDSVTGALLVLGGKRLEKQEAAAVRAALANGQEVVFANRHQWRHFHRHLV
jgi:hypothetical protein